MAKNQCELTQAGCNALSQLLKVVYPGGYTEIALSEDTGLSRDTLDKIFDMLHKNPQKPMRSVQYIKLEQLFDRLNHKLADHQRDQHSFKPLYCQEISDRRHGQKSPRSISAPSTVPPQQQLAMRLSRLNYTTGQAKFEDSLKRLKPAGAFLLQVPDTKVQQWLVRRLAEKVLGFENGKKLEINVACLGGNFEALWGALARQLKLSAETAEATIAGLSDLCQGKTVIITLFRFQRLDVGMQQRVMREFWFPLVQQMSSQQSDWRSRLVLFLIQDSQGLEDLPLSPFDGVSPKAGTHPELPVILEPLMQIVSPDIQSWFEQEGFDLLSVHLGEQEAEQFMQRQEFANWEPHPWTTLENICNVFRTEISEIEHYWRLVG